MEPILTRLAKRCVVADKEQCLPGREEAILPHDLHAVLHTPLIPPFPDHLDVAVFALGCFWGAERCFWQLDGVHCTAVGYTAGYTPNPTYEEVCSGKTGHTEAVIVVYAPERISYRDLLKVFWESHNPTQGMRQGNDVGTQYRSGIYCSNDENFECAEHSKRVYQSALSTQTLGSITTEIQPLHEFYYAESYHQQYLAKNPSGYCGLGGLGVPCRLVDK